MIISRYIKISASEKGMGPEIKFKTMDIFLNAFME
jgi:hypothetical protein